MKSNIKSSISAASLVIIMSLCGVQTLQAADPMGGPSVTVVNTTARPVPVTVQNPVTNVSVRSADNPAFQPYQHDDSGVLSQNGFTKTAFFDVPAGKRLVIELVTIVAFLDIGNNLATATITVTPPGGVFVRHHLTRTPTGEVSGGPATGFTVTQPLRLYCEAGTGAVRVDVERLNNTGLFSTQFGVSGYLVDLP